MFAPQTLWKHLIKFLYYFFEEDWKHFELLYNVCWIFIHKLFAFVSDVLLLLLPWYLKCFHNGFCTALTQQYQLLSQFYGKTIVQPFKLFGWFSRLKHCIDIWNAWSMFSNIQWQNISWCFWVFLVEAWPQNWKCMSDVYARTQRKHHALFPQCFQPVSFVPSFLPLSPPIVFAFPLQYWIQPIRCTWPYTIQIQSNRPIIQCDTISKQKQIKEFLVTGDLCECHFPYLLHNGYLLINLQLIWVRNKLRWSIRQATLIHWWSEMCGTTMNSNRGTNTILKKLSVKVISNEEESRVETNCQSIHRALLQSTPCFQNKSTDPLQLWSSLMQQRQW